MILTLKNLLKQYKDKLALHNFSLEMNEGVYGLLGPNGAGKTTLMRIAADVLRPTTGNILIDGADKNSMGDSYRELLGYLPQDLGLYRNFTARSFLLYVAALKGLDKRKAKVKADELIELVGLKDDAERYCKTYSGGMKRRLGIAQALLNDPKILVMDEPTAGLDPKERIRFRNLISSTSGNRIVILSTHIVSDLDMIAGTVILLKNGSVLRTGGGDTLLDELKDKVWTVDVPYESFQDYEDRYPISNIVRKSGRLELRVISGDKPSGSAIPEVPTLEDMYLYHFNEKASAVFEEVSA